MVRNRRKKALYEVISEGQFSPDRGRGWQQDHPKRGDEDTSGPEKPSLWPRRPKIFRFGSDRLELSVPYQLVIAAVLGVILLLLVVFRLGQSWQSSSGLGVEGPEVALQQPAASSAPEAAEEMSAAEKVLLSLEEVAAEVQQGNNRIVIQTYQFRAALEPVKQYFAQFGIESEIRKIDDWYYLVTRSKYENPERAGTDGWLAKQEIIKLGADYKAPEGYESFGNKPFYDAYGKKFDD